jgi:hypothetical protein
MHDKSNDMAMEWNENLWAESQEAAPTVQTQTTTYRYHACSYLEIAVA